MIHSVNTPANFAAVMDPILFPITAFGTPFGATIALTHKRISGIETLESRAVGVAIGPGLVGAALDIICPIGPSHPLSVFRAPSADCQRAKRNDTGVEVRIVKGPHVGSNHQDEEDEVKNEKSNGRPILVERAK